MGVQSIFQPLAEEIFSDKRYKDNDDAAAIHFVYSLVEAAYNGDINYDKANLFVMKENDDLDKISRLASLLPIKLTLTNVCQIVSQLDHGVYFDCEQKCLVEWEKYGFLPQQNFLKWFKGALPLLKEGIIDYYPNTITFLQYPDGSEKRDERLTIKTTSTCASCGQIINEDYQLSRIAELKIPYLYDISLENFGKISTENIDILNNFRSFFAKTIAGIDFTKKKEIADFQYSLQREVKGIEMSLKKEALKLAGSLTIGALTTIGASLMLFHNLGELYDVILGLSGGGGALQACHNIFAYQIEKISIKNEDCYFLCLLHK